jgi:polysaccharide pyruvyl transferase WcaK-like protein
VYRGALLLTEPGRPVHIIAIGDVGVTDGMMHIGDEAMFEALVDELRLRGTTSITAVSAAPAESATRYRVSAIHRIGFPADRAAGADRFAAVLDALSGRGGLPADDPFWAVRDAVADADAVVIAGGGNLASTWPLHIFERAALARIAAHFDRPLVITGQTLGPALSADDRPILAETLASARLVGLREAVSGELAARLGVEEHARAVTLDDASFLGWSDPPPAPEQYTLVSLSTHLGGRSRSDVVAGLARALDTHADETGRTTVFHAHWGSLTSGGLRGDAVLHDEVRQAMRHASAVAPTGDARSAASLARRASLLVTSRYHPAVFAAPAGVPVLGLTADAYTTVKLNGALRGWGQSGIHDLDIVTSGGLSAALRQAASRASVARQAAHERLPAARADAAAWWDRVVAAVSSSRSAEDGTPARTSRRP